MVANDKPEPTTLTAGAKPKLGWLPVARLSVDARYQRTLESRRSQKLIERLVDRFNWSVFQAVVVTENGADWLIIDGQHRTEAARRRGETHIPAVIVAPMSTAEQAAIFVSANQDRVAVNPFALYYAKLAAEDPDALKIDAYCKALKITVARGPTPIAHLKERETIALKVLSNIVTNGDVFGDTAISLLTLWPNAPGALSAIFIKAVRSVLEEDAAAHDKVMEFLFAKTPKQWLEVYRKKGGTVALTLDLRIAAIAQKAQATPSRQALPGPVEQKPTIRAPTQKTIRSPDEPVKDRRPINADLTLQQRVAKLARLGTPVEAIARNLNLPKSRVLDLMPDSEFAG